MTRMKPGCFVWTQNEISPLTPRKNRSYAPHTQEGICPKLIQIKRGGVMSKKKIIDAVAAKYPELTKADVGTVIDAAFNTITLT